MFDFLWFLLIFGIFDLKVFVESMILAIKCLQLSGSAEILGAKLGFGCTLAIKCLAIKKINQCINKAIKSGVSNQDFLAVLNKEQEINFFSQPDGKLSSVHPKILRQTHGTFSEGPTEKFASKTFFG